MCFAKGGTRRALHLMQERQFYAAEQETEVFEDKEMVKEVR